MAVWLYGCMAVWLRTARGIGGREMLVIIITACSIRTRHKYETKVPCNEVSLSVFLFRQKLEDLFKNS